MSDPRFFWLSLSLLFLLGKARASCNIPQATLSTNHVFLTLENNVWDLLHSDIVPAHSSIHLLCGDGEPPEQFDCDGSTPGSFNPPLPTTNCANVFQLTILEVNNIPACNKPPLAMYRVGYEYGRRFLEIYRSCYDKTKYAAQFSIHKVYRSSDSAAHKTRGFTIDGAMTGKEAASLKNNKIFNCFKAGLGSGQTYMPKGKCLFDRGHLTPSADFPFSELQRATYKLRNIVPQYKDVNNGNWKSVENWVRRLVDAKNENSYDVLKICTGSLKVKQLKNQQTHIMTPIYLHNNKIPVPMWTYKIISHLSGFKKVVITYNDIHEITEPDPEPMCKITDCDEDLNREGKGFTFCCKPHDFIRDNLKHLTGVC